jgi:branched-chain amino acid aminotransferase
MAFKIVDRIKKADKIWVNGEYMAWDECKVHVVSHVIHYGSALFEGFRAYKTPRGPAVFRLKEHIQRLFDSCKIYRMELPITQEEFCQAVLDTIELNKHDACYVRPIIFRGYGAVGVNPMAAPVDLVIATWEWGAYLGAEALEQGVDVCVSSWQRAAPNTFPSMAKCSANYANAALIKMEAVKDGYTEGIALNPAGHISEGSGENIFLVRDGVLTTPALGNSILSGLTRNCVIRIATEILGLEVREESIPREALYIADEVFFTGSAAEITPIRSVDKIPIGKGKRGEITRKLQEEFMGIVAGEREDRWGWLTYVQEAKK